MYQRYLGPGLAALAVAVVLGLAGIPVLTFLPFLILLACPLMHVFMMRNMDHGGHRGVGHGSHDRGSGGLHDEHSPTGQDRW